jgi:hypothetical protein
MAADSGSARRTRHGVVVGELLVAVLLLAVAVSSLAALMYSVSRRPESAAATACVEKSAGAKKCANRAADSRDDRLLRSSCLAKDGSPNLACRDSGSTAQNGVVLKSKTDSASLALLAKKEKPARPQPKPYRGFVR